MKGTDLVLVRLLYHGQLMKKIKRVKQQLAIARSDFDLNKEQELLVRLQGLEVKLGVI